MTTLHKAAQAALEALGHCREAIVERGLNGSEEFAAKWGLTLPLESSAKAINDLRAALAQEPAQPKGLFIDLIDSLGPEFAAELKAMDVPAVQEPVLYRFRDSECCIKAMSGYLPPKDWTPLYAQPSAPEPKRLTDEQIESAGARWIRDGHDWYGFARAIEAAVLGEKP